MSESLKSRQLIAALRALPEALPESIHGVAAYREAADAIEVLQKALDEARENLSTARGHVAMAVQRAWAENEIPASVREFLGMPARQLAPWRAEFGNDWDVPSGIEEVAGGRDRSWHNDACPSFTLAACEDTGCEVTLWCEHPDRARREDGAGDRFQCYLTVDDRFFRLWFCEAPEHAIALWRATAGLTDPWSRYAGMTGAELVTEARALGRRICVARK